MKSYNKRKGGGKGCPPGIFCIEYYSMFFILVCVVILVYQQYSSYSKQVVIHNNNSSNTTETNEMNGNGGWGWGWGGGLGRGWDTLRNPYVPPLNMSSILNYRLPLYNPVMSIATTGIPSQFSQIGVLTPIDGSGGTITLMGRALSTNRNKWQYYTMTDQFNSVKLPIVYNGKNTMDEYGCDEIYSGDTVKTITDNAYKVHIYSTGNISYYPHVY